MLNESDGPTVYVLGAGFTKAFAPDAPLLIDDYSLQTVTKEFSNLPCATRILEVERRQANENPIPKQEKCDFERLFTRLESKMPYDSELDTAELNVIKIKLIKSFSDNLKAATEKSPFKDDLLKFAKHCVQNNANCISLNYDNLFDIELRRAAPIEKGKKFWNYDGGYGFFCPSSYETVNQNQVEMDSTSMYLIKLHGSLNWKIRKGQSRPLSANAVVHHNTWDPSPRNDQTLEQIERHLEDLPFIIPPILNKYELQSEPIIKLLWSLAYKKLQEAKVIVFLGYSIPTTDFVASTLFAEAINTRNAKIIVVDKFATPLGRSVTRLNDILKPNTPVEGVEMDAKDWVIKNTSYA